MGYFRYKIIKKKKTGDQIWNEEQHSHVEFMLVMKFDG